MVKDGYATDITGGEEAARLVAAALLDQPQAVAHYVLLAAQRLQVAVGRVGAGELHIHVRVHQVTQHVGRGGRIQPRERVAKKGE